MPFTIPWTDTPPSRRHRESLKFWWSARANWTPESWSFSGAVFVGGDPVGVQGLMAKDFARLRTVETGSWLGRRHQGQGLGKEMRSAILHLAFEGLGAIEAMSGAFHDNRASLATSKSLGYVENGDRLMLRRNKPDRIVDLKLDRATWASRRRDDIEIDGLEACLEMFKLCPRPDIQTAPVPDRKYASSCASSRDRCYSSDVERRGHRVEWRVEFLQVLDRQVSPCSSSRKLG